MKKILSILAAVSLLAVAVPMVASAAVTQAPLDQCTITDTRMSTLITECPASGACVFETTKICGLCCTLQAVYKVTDWIFVIMIIIVALLIIWGAFQIVTAGGSPEKVSSGRNFILYALIGLAIALLARALPAIVKALIGA